MKKVFPYLIFLIFILAEPSATAQSVGLVLSGGGASGIAHIGVLKALEEYEIPVDYITGTSMGALVGGMYAAGYSPEEMMRMATSEEFRKMAEGVIDDKYIYYYKKKEKNASWVTMKLAQDTILQTSLPTGIISPISLDFEMMTKLSGASAAAKYNFDSLFVPFRCVASDIENKEQVIFREGHLNQAIRTSMSYPFYLRPITVNGKLLFDGGLYNNFPSDIMYFDFLPDVIIGSNVSGNFPPPNEDDIISQVKNMLVSKTNYSVICHNGIIIKPDVNIGLFDFSDLQHVIDSGYNATVEQMKTIREFIGRRISKEEVEQKRLRFRGAQPELIFSSIQIEGLKKGQSNYVQRILQKKKGVAQTVDFIKPRYFQVFGDDKIRNIYPLADFIADSGSYNLRLNVKKEKEIILDFGGNFSSRPINQAYLAFQYNYLSNIGISLMSNFYFGKLYGSAQAKARFDFPVSLPFYVEPEFTLNRWDYFKSKATFFEDAKPSYLVLDETYGAVNIGFPVSNKGKVKVGLSKAELSDKYYQTRTFLKVDTPDVTYFSANSILFQYERSSLNHKQYANRGSHFAVKTRLVEGDEFNIPGSTSPESRTFRRYHNWAQIRMIYDNYYVRKGKFRLGLYVEGFFSTQGVFNNYTASILRAPAFQPTPESKTLFLESFRAYRYGAIGKKVIFHIRKNLDFRLEGYLFQPYREILQTEDLGVKLGAPLNKRYTIATANAVYHTPLGPVSLGLNYYHNVPEVSLEDKTPLTVLFHFGYIIFNDKALE